MNEFNELIDDMRLSMDQSVVCSIKEALWQMSVQMFCEKYGVADDGLFAEVEEYFKQSCAAQPQIEPFIQDALVEFRTEARRMVER